LCFIFYFFFFYTAEGAGIVVAISDYLAPLAVDESRNGGYGTVVEVRPLAHKDGHTAFGRVLRHDLNGSSLCLKLGSGDVA
jgi:hypothetical protein